MVYILFLLLSMCYLSLLGRYGYGSYGKFVVFCFPVILLWCLIVGDNMVSERTILVIQIYFKAITWNMFLV